MKSRVHRIWRFTMALLMVAVFTCGCSRDAANGNNHTSEASIQTTPQTTLKPTSTETTGEGTVKPDETTVRKTQPVTYFVSPEGDDTADGKTESAAWKTLEKVNAQQLNPGDSVYLKRGGVWNEQLVLKHSGTADAPITVGAYGSGDLPVISGDSFIPSDRGQGLLQIDSASYVTVENIKISKSSSYGIKIFNSKSPVIRNCEIERSVDGGIISDPYEGKYSSDVLIEGNSIHENNLYGLQTWHEAITMAGVVGFEIRDNKVYNNNKEGIDAKYNAQNGSIHDNQCYDNNGPQIYIDAAHGIEIYNNRLSGSAADKAGLAMGVESEYNENKDNLYDITARNNVIYDNGTGISVWIQDGAEAWADIYNIKILNNTVVGNNKTQNAFGGALSITGSASNYREGSLVRNNIFFDNTRKPGIKAVSINEETAARFSIDHNMIKKGEPTGMKFPDTYEADSIEFKDESLFDYHLKAGSAAIDKGIDVGLPYNGAAPDIGAFEY